MQRKILLTLLLIFCAPPATYLFKGLTVAPVEILRIYPELYQVGDARRLHSAYLKDIVDVYLPWKFYLSEYSPDACEFKLAYRGRDFHLDGVRLPGGECYPLKAVRHHIYWDIFFPLRKLLGFFAAYDLSLWLFLGFFFGGALAFFAHLSQRLNLAPWATWFSAASLTGSFPVAREWQFDGPILGLPFLFFSLAAFLRSFSGNISRRRSFAWQAVSAGLLFLALFRTTPQGLGIYLMIYLFTLLIWARQWSARALWAICWIGGIATLGALWAHRDGLILFLHGARGFVPDGNFGYGFVFVRRTGAFLSSIANFIAGDLLWGFNTIDFTKVFRPLGAREFFSYDGANFFLNPLCSVVSITGLVFFRRSLPRPLWLGVVAALALSYLVVITPLYNLLYFRFHQWWLAITFSITSAWLLSVIGASDRRKLIQPALSLLTVVVLALAFSLVVEMRKGQIMAALGSDGLLGFEAGFWESRFAAWMARARFSDFYSLAYLALGAFSLWAIHKGWKAAFAPLALGSGIALNILYFNLPQDPQPFWQMIERLKTPSQNTQSALTRHRKAGNLKLLLNQWPAQIRESLESPRQGFLLTK